MPSALPEGDPAPADGSLPASALEGLGARPFGFYVHVPFCTVRCGYCDFNTYTATELGGTRRARARRGTPYAEAAIAEVRLARTGARRRRTCRSTRCSSAGARRRCCRPGTCVRSSARSTTSSAWRTTSRSPPSPTPTASTRATWPGCARAAINRMSFGMQSAVPHVLRVLDRTHDPRGCRAVVALGPRGRLRAGQPRPDLRHAGGVARRLAPLARRRPRLRARPRLGVRPDRRGRHRAGPAGPARRGADDRRRRPGRQVPPRRRGA